MFLRSFLAAVLIGWCSVAVGQIADDEAAAKALQIRVEKLIGQLGVEEFAEREAASKELIEIGNPARTALEKAALSTDPETSARARVILDRLPKLTHTIVDALGAPVPLARLSLQLMTFLPKGAGTAPEGEPMRSLADETGRVSIPEKTDTIRLAVALVEHPQYGRARCEIDLDQGPKTIQLPLVRQGSEAHARALSGQVINDAGEPIAEALVRCDDVRTPGEGLIDGGRLQGGVLTDGKGRFAIYLPGTRNDRGRGRERGELIPENSRFALRVSVPSDDTYFPLAGRYANTSPARLELRRAARLFRFRFESLEGGIIADAELLRHIRIQADELKDGERILTPLDPSAATKGSKLPTGKYIAELFTNKVNVEYQPVVITADSPDELVFRLPPAKTYQGRVVHGATGKPVKDAFVIGYRSTSRNNLALLTADEWKALRALPNHPPLDAPALQPLAKLYGVSGLVHTDADGRFEIRCGAEQEFYGLIAFAEDHVPYSVALGSLKPDDKQVVQTGEFPLFPAAKVLVRPSFAGERLSVSPEWVLADDKQPEWFERFRAASKNSQRQFEYVHWLEINEVQPIFVPAGIRLQLRFDVPYDDKWVPALVKEPLQLEAGTTHDIGDVSFAEAMQASVRVVDKAGKPVEGLPVRRMYAGSDSWSVAHNSDQDGLVHFYLHPNSRGKVRVSDLPGPQAVGQASNLFAEFAVADKPPAEPIAISVTDEQIGLLRGAKK